MTRLSKLTSILTSFSFLITSVVTPATASVSRNEFSPVEAALVRKLTPPKEFGMVVDVHVGANATENSPLVIHIQDLHASYQVQSNIVKLLEFLNSQLGDGNYKIAIEGAEGPLAVAQLGKLGNRELKAKVCDGLMKEAELTGTQYFSIVNGKPDILVGAEDERYHRANIALFQKTHKGKQEIVKSISAIEADLQPIKEKYYDRRLRKLDEKERKLASHKITLHDYLRFVARVARKRGIDVSSKYPEIAKTVGYLPADRYTDLDKLLTQKVSLVTEVRESLAKNEIQRNMAQVEKDLSLFRRFMSEQVTTEEVRRLAPRLSEVAGRAKSLLDSINADYDKANLTELVSAGLDYYAIALARDKFLTENALKLFNAPPFIALLMNMGSAPLSLPVHSAGRI